MAGGPRRRVRAAIVVVAVVMLVGFASGGVARAAETVQAGALGTGKGAIYLIRKHQSACRDVVDVVDLDGRRWGILHRGRYLAAEVDSGPHVIQIGGERHNKKMKGTLQVTVAPGQRLYLLRTFSVSFTWSKDARTEVIDEKRGRALLAKYQAAAGSYIAAAVAGGNPALPPGGPVPAPGPDPVAQAWASWGRWAEAGELISRGRAQEAITRATRMLLAGPEEPTGHLVRGIAFLITGDAGLAEVDFDRALATGSDDGVTFAYRGFARERLGRNEEAEADLTAAIDRGVERTEVYMEATGRMSGTSVLRRRGVVRYRLGRPEDAVDDLTRALAADPDDPFLYLDRARAELAAGDLDAAMDDGMTLAGLLPAGPHAYDVMGTVRWWRGEYGKAAELHQRAVERASGPDGRPGAAAADSLHSLALDERLGGEPEQALEHLQAAIKLRQSRPAGEDYLLLGTLLHEAGKTGAAAGAFRRASDLDPRILERAVPAAAPVGSDPRSWGFVQRQRSLMASYVQEVSPTASPGVSTARPTVDVRSITVSPAPVVAGEPFTFTVGYAVTGSARAGERIGVELVVEILRDGAVVFATPEQHLEAAAGEPASWVQRMNPTTATGEYTVRVRTTCGGEEQTMEVRFRVEPAGR